MARTKSSLRINAEFYPIKALFSLLRALPLAWSEALSRWLLRGLIQLLPAKRHIMAANLAFCFPDRSDSERARIARSSLDNLARGVAVFCHEPNLLKPNAVPWIITEGVEHLDAALSKGKGVIHFTTHFGCWEIMAGYVHTLRPRVAVVTRPLDNPRLEGLVSEVRGANLGKVIPHKHVVKEGLRWLRQNGILGILIDQNFYKGGIFVDFFGRLAATTPVVSLLARRTGCEVLPIRNRWEGDRLRIIIEPPIALSRHPDTETAMAEDTQLLAHLVEEWIRKDPEQWLWLHNRWKRRPAPGDAIYLPGVSARAPFKELKSTDFCS